MTRLALFAGTACWAAAALVGRADADTALAEVAALARPVALPFLWRSLDDASRTGTPAEAFGKAQLLLRALPSWADGYTVFAWRYALDGGDASLPPAAHARASKERLEVALAVLDSARAGCRTHEVDLLVAMSWLVELAVRQEPAVGALLGEDPALLADRYLVAAEQLGAGRMVREQRLFAIPRLVGALLAVDARAQAIDLLAEGIRRCDELRERDVGADWGDLFRRLQRALQGDPSVDRGALRADSRLESVATFLR